MQEGQWYVSLVLPMKYIIDNSSVLVYGEDEEYGYQRAPKKSHYGKIAKQLLEKEKRSVASCVPQMSGSSTSKAT